jgi:hypothetical protein
MDCVYGAFAQADPRTLVAAGGGLSAILLVSTIDPDTARYHMNVLQPMEGGMGGRGVKDGVAAADFWVAYLRNVLLFIGASSEGAPNRPLVRMYRRKRKAQREGDGGRNEPGGVDEAPRRIGGGTGGEERDDNGQRLLQAKVWGRLYHASLEALQGRSHRHVQAYRRRAAPRIEGAPQRYPDRDGADGDAHLARLWRVEDLVLATQKPSLGRRQGP